VFNANLQLNGSLALVAAMLIAVFAGPIMQVYGNAFRGGRVVLLVLACSAIAEVFNAMLGQPLVATHKMWWRFGFDVLFVVLLVGFAWVLIPKRGASGLAAAYGFAYACTSLVFFSFISKARGVASRSQQSQRQPAAKVTGIFMREL
jgi:O-antigen/teichoic acid export membrane protein